MLFTTRIALLMALAQLAASKGAILRNGHHSENYYAIDDSYISWHDAGESIDFTVSTVVENDENVWTAIGFSHDQQMVRNTSFSGFNSCFECCSNGEQTNHRKKEQRCTKARNDKTVRAVPGYILTILY